MRHCRRGLLLAFVVAGQLISPIAAEGAPANRWEDEIRAFERSDAKRPPPQGAVLFIGSSSVRLWKRNESFPEMATPGQLQSLARPLRLGPRPERSPITSLTPSKSKITGTPPGPANRATPSFTASASGWSTSWRFPLTVTTVNGRNGARCLNARIVAVNVSRSIAALAQVCGSSLTIVPPRQRASNSSTGSSWSCNLPKNVVCYDRLHSFRDQSRPASC
jgi:hypothetical protein